MVLGNGRRRSQEKKKKYDKEEDMGRKITLRRKVDL